MRHDGVMDVREVLIELYDRIPEHVREAVDGLTPEQLRAQPEDGSNPIGWLVWHLTRVQDDHVAEVIGEVQVWTAGGWAPRFGLPDGVRDTGSGHDRTQVATVVPEGPQVLVRYLEAVTDRTLAVLGGLDADALDRVVDTSWDPPVTLGVRLVSVLTEGHAHVGQAAYVRGLFDARPR